MKILQLNEIIELHRQTDWSPHRPGEMGKKQLNNGIRIKIVCIAQNYFSVKE
jgi:hypothetical protein